MYTINTRPSGEIFRADYKRVQSGVEYLPHTGSAEFAQLYEMVYSWRTGKLARETPQQATQSLFGIAVPPKTGSLVDRLRDRKEFIENLDRTINASGSLGNNSQAAGRCSRSDTGHEFSKITVFTVPATGYRKFRYGNNDFGYGNLTGLPQHRGTIGNPIPWTAQPFFLDQKVSNLAFQKQVSDVFAQASPDKNDASLLTTAVELLRGDVPSILKNFRKYWDDGQSLAKSLGSEYLNVQFGWAPLFREVAGIIKHLMTLDQLLYYGSTRRHRAWAGPATRSETSITNGTGTFLSTLTIDQLHYTRDLLKPTMQSLSVQGDTAQTSTWVQDYRLSARFAGIARPSRAADQFNDKALAVLENLGIINDPKILWELTPFSWLADWAVNIGSAMENATYYSVNNGGRSIDYAYVTTKTVSHIEERLLKANAPGFQSSQRIDSGKCSITTTQVDRKRVSPFGIGVDMSTLTSGQFNILVALGLAKLR